MNEHESHFVKSAKSLLDDSLNTLDRSTLAALATARVRALEDRSLWSRIWRPFPVALAAGLASLLLVAVFSFRSLHQDAGENLLVADLNLLTSEDSVEFIEDMDFYEWLSMLDAQPEDVSHRSDSVHDTAIVVPRPCPAATDVGAGVRSDRIPRSI